MRELERRNKIKQRLYSTPVLTVVGFLSLALAHGAYGALQKEHQSARDVQSLETKVVALSDRDQALGQEIDKLKTKDGLDQAIKEKFNVAAADERVALIIDQAPDSTTSSTTTRPWYKRLWDVILSAL